MRHPEGPFANHRFDHVQHVRFAWSAVREVGLERAECVVSDEIRDFAGLHAPGKYNQTMTSFWVRLVAHTIDVDDPGDFDEHLERFPVLLNKGAARLHYSHRRLTSDQARESFVTPDVRNLP